MDKDILFGLGLVLGGLSVLILIIGIYMLITDETNYKKVFLISLGIFCFPLFLILIRSLLSLEFEMILIFIGSILLKGGILALILFLVLKTKPESRKKIGISCLIASVMSFLIGIFSVISACGGGIGGFH